MAEKSSEPPPSYSQVQGESSSSHAPQHTVVYGPTIRGPDIDYLKSPGGISKIVEAVSVTVT